MMRFAAPYIYPVLWNRQNSSQSLLREKNLRTMEFLITVKAIGIPVMSKYQNIYENCRIFKNWNFHRNQHVRFNKAPTFYLLKYTKLFYIIVVPNFFWDFGSDYVIRTTFLQKSLNCTAKLVPFASFTVISQ